MVRHKVKNERLDYDIKQESSSSTNCNMMQYKVKRKHSIFDIYLNISIIT